MAIDNTRKAMESLVKELLSKGVRVEKNEEGVTLFHANDVCDVLGFENHQRAMERYVDGEWFAYSNNFDTAITEEGLYSLIMASTHANAAPFKKWVLATLLPSLRKIGSFDLRVETLMDCTPPSEMIDTTPLASSASASPPFTFDAPNRTRSVTFASPISTIYTVPRVFGTVSHACRSK